MPRFRFDLAYDGGAYFGWQKQPEQLSVQEVIEDAFSKLNSNVHIPVVGCGRTDTGVHAHHYVLHADLETSLSEEAFLYKLNRILPSAIAFKQMTQVSDDFHARFDATERSYRYFISQQKDPFADSYSWLLLQDLDMEAMNEAAKYLIGKRDFTSFSKLHTDVKTNICDVRFAEWQKSEDGKLFFEIRADRFLRNMVRATVGTLVDVGLHKLKPADIPLILDKMDRSEASTSVPAKGLFLWKIDY